MELVGFVHFSVNTFTDREWGFGDESPAVFSPAAFDAGQWASVAAEVGMGELILTAKHHDGFCLWPSDTTGFSVRSSPWRQGRGDVVREFVEACRGNGIQAGLYLSPWDRHHAEYGRPAYLDDYRAQLRELLSGYGPIAEVWFDGANGGTGFYGGANEERRIDRAVYYRWPETWALVKSLQPKALIFSDAGPDIRWIGNEGAVASETNWAPITTGGIVVGEADPGLLNTGDPAGKQWTVPLCNTSIRPGWFYHPDEDGRVKSPRELVDIYYKSVGRNGVLLLNVPPDKRGLFHDADIRALRGFRRILDETFAEDLAAGAGTAADSVYRRHARFTPANLVDGDPESYWAAADGARRAELDIDLGRPVEFDRLMLQEPIRLGQRVAEFEVLGRSGEKWFPLCRGTTIGYKRLLRFPAVRADRIRILILRSLNTPALSRVGLFRASPDEPDA
jgi:alpha-L-fucosidase